MDAALITDEKCRAAPNTQGTQRQRGGDATAVADTAGGNDGLRLYGVNDLRDQWKITDCSGVAAGFVALSDDNVGAFAGVTQRVLHGACERHHLNTLGVSQWYYFCGIAQANDEDRHLFLKYNFQLFAGCRGRLNPA